MKILALVVCGAVMILGMAIHSTDMIIISAVLYLSSVLDILFGE